MLRASIAFYLLLAVAALAADHEEFKARLTEMQAALVKNPTNLTLLFRIADLCHDEGVKENKEAVKLSEKYLRELLALSPSNAPALALLGSTYTMKGRDAFWPGTQLSLVKEGNRFMDEAVTLAPENFQVRLMRGLNNVHMPGFLKREEIARTDLQWVWSRISAQPSAHPVSVRQEVALWYGVALKKAKHVAEARVVWEAGRALDPSSKFAVEILKQLEKSR